MSLFKSSMGVLVSLTKLAALYTCAGEKDVCTDLFHQYLHVYKIIAEKIRSTQVNYEKKACST